MDYKKEYACGSCIHGREVFNRCFTYCLPTHSQWVLDENFKEECETEWVEKRNW